MERVTFYSFALCDKKFLVDNKKRSACRVDYGERGIHHADGFTKDVALTTYIC